MQLQWVSGVMSVLLLGGGLTGSAWQQAPGRATAVLRDAGGREVGRVSLSETPAGGLLRVELRGLPPGWHALHVHGTGRCEPPFQSAGAHWNPAGHPHGFFTAQGGHAGDLPNVLVGPDSSAAVELVAPLLVLSGPNGVLDADGAAVVIHAGSDDYRSDPAGNAGGRIACGVLERS